MNINSGKDSQTNEPLADWFTTQISRRSLGKGLAWAGVLGMAGVTLVKLAGDKGSQIDYDSLELQKKEGWNVGSTEKTLYYPAGTTAFDSQHTPWNGVADPNYLISVYQPRGSQWQPFFVPTLIQSLAQSSLSSQIKPFDTSAMDAAYGRAEGLRNLISQSTNANQTLIVADLPGPESIALGAAMADTVQLVPVFDNWPHPLGVVNSHEVLGAMLYYAHEVEEKKSKLKDDAPALMLLDNRRLANYRDETTQFDNRYLAKLPPADQLKQRGIKQAIYLVKDETQDRELDDINDDLVEWRKNGIDVRMLRLSDFKPYDEPAQAAGIAAPASPAGPVVETHHYYYGGSPLAQWWFFNHYLYGPPHYILVNDGGYTRNIPRPSS
ncbi:MAG: hypothetical protein J2P31_05340, partial [Blastocatellia bacterium]|nr:hypothetical protein [Blastocatellia bacterium]